MIRSILFSCLLLLGCGYVQSTWLSSIALLGVTPDLALLLLIWISYKNGIVEGPCAGFLSGLAEDFLSAAPLGFNAFVKTAVATCAGFLHGVFFIDRVVLPFVLGALGTLAKALAAGFLAILFSGKLRGYDFLGKELWIEAAYNGLAAPFLFLLLSPLKRLLVTERGRE
ncbi:MAG TPA: rod shape-determining protein MreD [Spirochaetia bacterium]|nr:rod shape-determining protein MreD [Spirochaetia bacterium]